MKIHILGICGTFMGGLAQLCVARGWSVEGSDAQVYPPMSEQLANAGIVLHEGFDPEVLSDDLDWVVVGNALSRGNVCVEACLSRKLPIISGPELLGRLTRDATVLAVAGTHGKTTTTSMLAWILEVTGHHPGFLVGGVPTNFGVSARSGAGDLFVVEADEYDTAFFDKRSKFVHYHPDVFGINNLEFDHADIFPDLHAIETQFHHAIRRVPSEGSVVIRSQVEAINRVIDRGVWSPVIAVGADTDVTLIAKGSTLHFQQTGQSIQWTMRGAHNAANAELAIAMAGAIGVPPDDAFQALANFQGVARRLNCLFESQSVRVWDDFAHHPTAISATLDTLHAEAPDAPILAVIELRSNTMRAGIHMHTLRDAVKRASEVIWVTTESLDWDLAQILRPHTRDRVLTDIESVLSAVENPVGTVVCMSNGGFGGLQRQLVARLENA